MANRVVAELAEGSPRGGGGVPSRDKNRLAEVPVERIRPEEGLGRKRDRQGHRELCRSIEQFGVLTPITVRNAPDGSGDYLLIKGQGRTLACRLLGISTVPAIVVDDDFAETEKVQQFLVENVARLRMRSADRALLIAHARRQGEQTVSVAQRFGVSSATVRRLEAQLDGATSSEVAALRAGDLNLALHAVIARRVEPGDRASVIKVVRDSRLRARELEALLTAIGWLSLSELGVEFRDRRIDLLAWACEVLTNTPRGDVQTRLREVARRLPISLAPQVTDPAEAVS